LLLCCHVKDKVLLLQKEESSKKPNPNPI